MTVTNGDLSRRVEELESKVGGLDAKVDSLVISVALIQRDQEHGADLGKAQYDALSHAIAALGSKFETAQLAGATMVADPLATPAGRIIMEKVADNGRRTDANTRFVQRASGALALLVILAPFAADVVRAFLHLP